jgi:elongation factor G
VRLGVQEQGRAAAARRGGDYLPSPIDVPAIKGVDEDGNEVVRLPNDKEPLALLAFKIMDDPFVGTITFCRIYSGTLSSGTGVVNSTRDRKERIGRMLLMHANNREDIKEAYAATSSRWRA